MEIKSSKDYHQTEQGKKGGSNAHTHIEDTQRLVTEVSSTTYKKQKLPESYKGWFHFTDYPERQN